MSTSNEEKAAAKEELEKEEQQQIEPAPSTSGEKQTEDKAVDATGPKPSETEEQPPKDEEKEEGTEVVKSDGKLPLGTVRNRRVRRDIAHIEYICNIQTKKHMQELIISLCKGVVDIRFNPDCYMPHVKHAPEEVLEVRISESEQLTGRRPQTLPQLLRFRLSASS
jgi:hypothetical protein